MLKAIRVTEYWQRACVYYIRIDEWAREFQTDVSHELDSGDTEDTPYILVLDEKGIPASTCRLHYLDGTTGKIERVCTLKEYRGTGAGSLAIRAAEDWLKENGVKQVMINSRDTAIGFYEKLGYTTDWDSLSKPDPNRFGTVNTYKTL